MDWLNALSNIEQAAANCDLDFKNDWHRDPWTWPEVKWATTTEGSDKLRQRFDSGQVKPMALLDVPKENFVLRPATVLDPIDRLMYESLVDKISMRLIGDLNEFVYGWRLTRDNPQPGCYSPNGHEWRLFHSHLSAMADRAQCVLKTDVVSCFASIPVESLTARIIQCTGTNEIAHRIISMIETWQKTPGRSGLPQRCNASSILANMYLTPIDDALRWFGRNPKIAEPAGRDVAALRWMDDIWIFGEDPGHLRCAQIDIQERLYGLGLQINAAKTAVLSDTEMLDAVKNFEHSGVDAALAEDPKDARPLSEMITGIVRDPETTSKTSVRFATTRMRTHRLFDGELKLISVAQRMPHAADALARLFRASGRWQELDGWYTSFPKSGWPSIGWATASFGTMFPAHWGEWSRSVLDLLADSLERRATISEFALASQRLAIWSPDTARSIFRETVKRGVDAHQRRILALAALTANEERPWIKSLLSEFEENKFLLAFLETRGFAPIKADKDFEG